MSISLASNAGGTAGSIKINGVDQLTIGADGSLTGVADPATGLRSKALATMQKFADEFVNSIASSGYQKLPSGLILQWGTYAGGANNPVITLPMAFPNSNLVTIAGSTDNTSLAVFLTGTKTVSSFKCDQRVANTGGSYTGTFNWIAIGY